MKEKILKGFGFKNLNFFVENSVFLILGFLLSFARISGIFSPFCLAFCVSVSSSRVFFSFCGGLLGLLCCLSSENLVYFFALILGFVLKSLFRNNCSSFANAIYALVSLAIPKLFIVLIMPVSFSSWIIDYCEVVFCASSAFLFSRTLKKNFDIKFIQFYDFVGLFLIAFAFLVSTCYFNFFGLNLGKLFAIFLILEALLCVGIGGVSVVGLFVASGLILFTKNFVEFALIATYAGFLTGVFSSLGRVFKLAIFNLVFFLCSIFWGGLNLSSLFEVFLASVVVGAVPLTFLENFFAKNKFDKIKTKFKLNDELSLKLQFTARTLLDLQSSIEQCAKNFDSLGYKDIFDVYTQVAVKVCKSCGLNTFCWVKSYNEITRCFNDVSKQLREGGVVSEKNLPVFLKHNCCKQKALADSINFEYKDFICKKQTSRRINEARAVAAEQFTGMAELLVEMSQEILEVDRIDSDICEIVSQIFNDELIKVEGLFCFIDKFERLTIDAYLNSLPDKNELKKIANLISSAIEKEIEFPSITKAKSSFKLSFFEAATLKIDFAAKQTSPDGNDCCGDSYDYFMDGKGFAHMILSDGMGSGKRACVDSLMTCFTMRKLIETGFGFNSTLKLLNLSFSIKSKEESLATIDACTIDLYSGYAKFVKAGATASYISIDGKVVEFVSKSLPIGIIQGISFDSKEFQLKRGDVIVMVSDGATSTGFDWISNKLQVLLNQTAKTIASTLLKEAKNKCDPNHKDDITIMVAKIV